MASARIYTAFCSQKLRQIVQQKLFRKFMHSTEFKNSVQKHRDRVMFFNSQIHVNKTHL